MVLEVYSFCIFPCLSVIQVPCHAAGHPESCYLCLSVSAGAESMSLSISHLLFKNPVTGPASSQQPLRSLHERRSADLPFLDVQVTAREEGEGMETTDLERGSPAGTPAQSLEQLLSSPEARLGALLCLILSSRLINITLIYKCSLELLSKKNFSVFSCFTNGKFGHGQIWLSVFCLLTLGLLPSCIKFK